MLRGISQFSLLARFYRIFAMYRARAHRSRKVSKDCTRSGHAIFDTFGIFERDQKRPAQGGMTMAVDSMAIRKAAGIGTATALSTFSAIVHNNSADRCKLFLRLGIGDGTFPESAKKRQKAPFGGATCGGRHSAAIQRIESSS